MVAPTNPMLVDRVPVIRAHRDRCGRIRQPQSSCCGDSMIYVPVGTQRWVVVEGDLWLDELEPRHGLLCRGCFRRQTVAALRGL